MQTTAQEPLTLVAVLSTANLILLGIVTYFVKGFIDVVRTFMDDTQKFREGIIGRVATLEGADRRSGEDRRGEN